MAPFRRASFQLGRPTWADAATRVRAETCLNSVAIPTCPWTCIRLAAVGSGKGKFRDRKTLNQDESGSELLRAIAETIAEQSADVMESRE